MSARSDAAKARARERVHVFINSGATRGGSICYVCGEPYPAEQHDLTRRARSGNAHEGRGDG